MRAIVADIIVERLEAMQLEFPKPDPEAVARFDKAHAALMKEGKRAKSD